ncbi:MAG: hypothetical protein QNJ14_13320 [Woeseiaceae bacterium]|nr:hypothetical protein [Woeseiaceae bacterium]
MGGYDIREFGDGPIEPAAAADIAGLHAALLDTSPLVLMGSEFVREFYYTVLPSERLICGAVAYVDGQPAGFIVGTDDPDGFMDNATRRYRLRIAWTLFKSVLRRPSSIAALLEARRIQRNVKDEKYGSEVGELLSFGVLPRFRSREFIRKTGVTVSADLLRCVMSQLERRGKKRLRAIVDKDNREAQLFYRLNGWRVGSKDVKGWRTPTMEFLFDYERTTDVSIQS